MTKKRAPLQEASKRRSELSRRDFLKAGAAAGAMAVVTSCVPKLTTTPSPSPAPTPALGTVSPVFDALQFFDAGQAAIVHAAAGRIIPGTPEDPGAKEAAVVVFIDRALAGYDIGRQPQYIAGVPGMEAYAQAKYRKSFVNLSEQQQDDILTSMQNDTEEARKFLPDPPGFFATLLNHTRQGMFTDPVYGGNRNSAGWKLEGHPGIVFGRDPSEQKCDADFPKKYMGNRQFHTGEVP